MKLRIALLSTAVAVCAAAPLFAQTLTTWQNPVKVTASDGALTKSSGCDGCADSGAYSGTQLTGDGYSEFVAPALTRLYAGLGTDLTASTASSTINYSFSLWPTGAFEIRELGVYKADGTYAAGDRFRVAVESGVVVYRRNGTLIYTSKTAPTYPLVLDVSLYALGAQMTQASLTAGTTTSVPSGTTPDPQPSSGTPVGIAPYTAIVDRNPYTKPALPALGPAGSTLTDPVFTTSIRRITDNFTRPGALDRSYRTPSSPHQNAWSVNSSYFYLTGSGGIGPIPFAFDAATGTARRLQPTTTGDGGLVLKFYIEPQFSYVSDSIIYGSYSGSGSTLHTIDQYDFSTGTYTKLLDLETIEPGLSGTYIGGLASSAGPTEQIVTFFGGTSQDHHHYVVVFDRNHPETRQVLDTIASTLNGSPTPITLNFSLHHAMIDRSGRYVMLYTTSADQGSPRYAAQEYLWDLQTGAMTEIGTSARPYGHDAFGYGVLVNQDCCTTTTYDAAQWQFRSLSAPLVTRDVLATVLSPKEVYLADHTSWNSARADGSMPVVSGLYRYGTSNTTAWRAWDDEIIAIQTNGPAAVDPTVWRFAHHRTNVAYDGDASRTAFWYQPHPNVSQDGKWILFTSNWEKTLGTDPQGDAGTSARQDVFLLALKPSALPIALASAPLPGGRVGVLYAATLSASGGSGAYRWSTPDALPAGLSLGATTGVISGTPTAYGTTTVRITVTDAANATSSATAAFSIAIASSAVTIGTSTLPSGRVTQAYSAALAASGGTGSYAWSISSGALPPGLVLDAAGLLSGVPSAAGDTTVTLTAADASDATNRASATLTIHIGSAPLTITTTSLPHARVSQSYAVTLLASGGSGSASWTIASGALPAGISLNAATGALSGTATTAAVSTFVAYVTDTADAANTASAALTLTVDPSAVQITTTTLPGGRATQPYTASLAATGGSGRFAWSVVSGALPGGVTLDSVSGALSGTPSAAGTATFTVRVSDASDPTDTADASFAVTVGPSPVAIVTATLPSVRATQPYAATLGASGGTGTYTWTIVSGALPAGIALNTASGALSGTPLTPGTSAFTARVIDQGDATNVADRSLAISVADAPVQLSGGTLAGARISIPYTATLTAAGGCGTFSWSVVGGALPAGLTLNAATGVIGGTPTATGVATFTVSATDTADATNVGSAAFSIAVSGASMQIMTTTLPSGRERVAYNAGVQGTGSVGSIVWSVVSGLPGGLTLNTSSGAIGGTPTTAGTYTLTVKATDSADATNTATASLAVVIAPAIKITSPRTLPDAALRTAYTYAITYSYAVGNTKWNLQGGGLPPGLSLNTTTGVISGVPTAKGTYSFNARVKDSSTDDTLTLTINVK